LACGPRRIELEEDVIIDLSQMYFPSPADRFDAGASGICIEEFIGFDRNRHQISGNRR